MYIAFKFIVWESYRPPNFLSQYNSAHWLIFVPWWRRLTHIQVPLAQGSQNLALSTAASPSPGNLFERHIVSTPDLLNQKQRLWGAGPAMFLISSPGDPDACWSLRTTIVSYSVTTFFESSFKCYERKWQPTLRWYSWVLQTHVKNYLRYLLNVQINTPLPWKLWIMKSRLMNIFIKYKWIFFTDYSLRKFWEHTERICLFPTNFFQIVGTENSMLL